MKPEPTYEELLDQADLEREAQRDDLALREQELCGALGRVWLLYTGVQGDEIAEKDLETLFSFCGQSKFLEQLRGK